MLHDYTYKLLQTQVCWQGGLEIDDHLQSPTCECQFKYKPLLLGTGRKFTVHLVLSVKMFIQV